MLKKGSSFWAAHSTGKEVLRVVWDSPNRAGRSMWPAMWLQLSPIGQAPPPRDHPVSGCALRPPRTGNHSIRPGTRRFSRLARGFIEVERPQCRRDSIALPRRESSRTSNFQAETVAINGDPVHQPAGEYASLGRPRVLAASAAFYQPVQSLQSLPTPTPGWRARGPRSYQSGNEDQFDRVSRVREPSRCQGLIHA